MKRSLCQPQQPAQSIHDATCLEYYLDLEAMQRYSVPFSPTTNPVPLSPHPPVTNMSYHIALPRSPRSPRTRTTTTTSSPTKGQGISEETRQRLRAHLFDRLMKRINNLPLMEESKRMKTIAVLKDALASFGLIISPNGTLISAQEVSMFSNAQAAEFQGYFGTASGPSSPKGPKRRILPKNEGGDQSAGGEPHYPLILPKCDQPFEEYLQQQHQQRQYEQMVYDDYRSKAVFVDQIMMQQTLNQQYYPLSPQDRPRGAPLSWEMNDFLCETTYNNTATAFAAQSTQLISPSPWGQDGFGWELFGQPMNEPLMNDLRDLNDIFATVSENPMAAIGSMQSLDGYYEQWSPQQLAFFSNYPVYN